MTDLCQLEGRTLKWQLAYFGPKVGYFGHIFQDVDFNNEFLQSVCRLNSCNFGYNWYFFLRGLNSWDTNGAEFLQ